MLRQLLVPFSSTLYCQKRPKIALLGCTKIPQGVVGALPESYCLKVPSDKGLNLLVQSISNHGTFYLNSHSTKFSNEFPQKMEKKNKSCPQYVTQ